MTQTARSARAERSQRDHSHPQQGVHVVVPGCTPPMVRLDSRLDRQRRLRYTIGVNNQAAAKRLI